MYVGLSTDIYVSSHRDNVSIGGFDKWESRVGCVAFHALHRDKFATQFGFNVRHNLASTSAGVKRYIGSTESCAKNATELA